VIPERSRPEVDALIDDLLTLPVGERRGALDARTGLDADLRRAVAAVLAEAEAGDSFLDPSIIDRRPLVDDLVTQIGRDHEDVLRAGTTFAGYEVLGLIGRGGMGEVYRARDPRLGRDVALKTLPLDFEDDPERAARFEREARVLAALNHPNVATIHGIAEEGATRALVLEFVEGETLADVLARGPVPAARAIDWIRQAAQAVRAAHARGIVHRDLKPANIKVDEAGHLKVLDFGLAKSAGGGERSRADSSGLTAAWQPNGAVLGTPAYMAPEQVLGAPAAESADAWALGCIFYELLTGARAFDGATPSEIFGRVLSAAPDLDRVGLAGPPRLRHLLAGLLEKDPGARLTVASLLEQLQQQPAELGESEAGSRVPLLAALALTAGAVIVAGVLGVSRWRRPDPPRTPVRLAVPVPPSDALLLSAQPVAAISPDGRTIVYRAVRDGRVHLFARALDASESRVLPGTENAAAPTFSPDGRWVAFDGDGMLRKLPVDGGVPITIGEARGGATAAWAADTIVFASPSARVLHQLPASGGTPVAITTLDRGQGQVAHAFPQLLPDATAALFTIITADTRQVAIVDLASREVQVITEGSQARYLEGYVVFVRNDTLWGAPFDPRRRTLGAAPRALLPRLDTAAGAAHYALSADGTLIYVPRREEVRDRRLAWVDRRGAEQILPLAPGRYQRATLSPDGKRIALVLAEGENTDLWMADSNGGTLTRLTTDPATDTAPMWSPDGRTIVFRSDRDGSGGLHALDVAHPSHVRRITTSGAAMHTPHGWVPDGRTLLFTEFRSYTEQAFMAVPLDGGAPRPLVGGSFAQLRPQVSPDGGWIAYQSDESGRHEIYLRRYPLGVAGGTPPESPDEDDPVRISIDGGTSPRWTRQGRELIYHDGRSFMAASIVRDGPRPRVVSVGRLFDSTPYAGRLGPDFDVTPDGERFLIIRPAEDTPESRAQLVLVQHWLDELRAAFVH
jgi:serine/threonine protein kinase/Tol biopolymer transport system component